MADKKGELTSQQLIVIIILIISFVIILAFFFMLDIGGTVNEESCRNSLSLSQIPFVKWTVGSKCKTQDVCISMGGDCQTPSKNPKKISVGSEEEIAKEISDLVARCWWMMGEGQIKYGGDEYCAICYKIYFDDKIKANTEIKKSAGIPYFKIYDSMRRKMQDKDFNYLYYLYGNQNFDFVKQSLSSYGIDISSGADKIDVNVEYIIITGFKDKAQFPPLIVRFSAAELKDKTACSNYITEI